ncbi:MAG: branched-chain amino acid ABC transporter permease [Ignisphaera sp.]
MVEVSGTLLAQVIVDGILTGALYALAALGLALIWGVVEVINFAHGEFIMIGSFLAYFLFIYLGLDPLLSIPLSFLVGFALGYLIQLGIINRILEAPFYSQIFATFAILLILRNSFYVALGPDVRSLSTWYSEEVVEIWGVRISFIKIIIAIVAVASIILLHLFLSKTFLGSAMRAMSQDRVAARLIGVNVKRTYSLAFGISTGLAGVAGSLLASFYYIYPEMGVPFTLIAFISVVLGGFGNIIGPVIGAFIIGITQNIGAIILIPSMKDVLVYILFLAFLLLRPTGIFKR